MIKNVKVLIVQEFVMLMNGRIAAFADDQGVELPPA